MRDRFYGDKRDLVKWAGIIHLCSIEGIKKIVYVAYYRKDAWPRLRFDGADITLPQQVINHFRDIEDINRLADRVDLDIRVIKREFDHGTRVGYTMEVCREVKMVDQRKVVFLDPDVGIALRRCKAEHVKPDEITMIWQSLNPQDFLVFYQHNFRSSDWVELCRNRLAAACGVKIERVRMWSAEQKNSALANDVVFFFLEKVV